MDATLPGTVIDHDVYNITTDPPMLRIDTVLWTRSFPPSTVVEASPRTAAFLDVIRCFIERRHIGLTTDHAPVTDLVNETGAMEGAKMEGERRGWYPQATLNFADGKALTVCPYENSDDVQPRHVTELGEALGRNLDVH